MENLEQLIQKKYSNIAGIVVMKDGKIAYEKYFCGCDAESRLHVFSVTKSIMSILIGIAIDKGYISGVDAKISDYLATKSNLTIKNFLTMTVPYKYWLAPYIQYFKSSDWVEFSLDLLGQEAGKFRYAPLIGPDILSGILEKATAKSVLDFANENLFRPLGILPKDPLIFESKEEQMAFNNSTNLNAWVADETGTNAAAWGLTLSAMDMAKIGQLFLNGGTWMGERIVSERWVKESTQEHSRWKRHNLPYGYLWWIGENGFAAMGDGGNLIFVNRKKNLVVSIVSKFKARSKDRIQFVEDYIEPMFL